MFLLKNCTNTPAGAPETHRGRDLQTYHLQVPQEADIWSMGCVLSEVATWISMGKPKLREYRRRRKQEILEKSKTDGQDCFHYLSEVLETVAQIHIEIMESRRWNDHITPSVIRQLVNGMIRPDPQSRGTAKYHLETSASILKEAKVNLKRSLPNPDHTVSDSHLDVRSLRLPPNLPPGRGHQVPARLSNVGKNIARPLQAAEFQISPPEATPQDLNSLQQVRSVRNPGGYDDQQGGEPTGLQSDYFTAQNEDPCAYRPSQRIASHPAASSVQNQQHTRSFTSMAEMARPLPNRRPSSAEVNTYDATGTPFLPQRPRDYRVTINDSSVSRGEPNDGLVEFPDSGRVDLANSNQTSFQNHQPTAPDTHTSSPAGRQSASHRPPPPKMSVAQGLKIKKAKRSSNAKYPGEDIFHTTDDILKKRDHVRDSIMFYLSST